MWSCPNCGKRVDDDWQACWNCGTAQDGTPSPGFQAEPGDPNVPGAGPEPRPAGQPAADPDAARAAASGQRIVELCSTANAIEAHALCGVLERAGIACRVEGEFLQGAAGGLPLGESTAPRIWVCEPDAAKAREIVKEWESQRDRELFAPAEGDEQAETEAVPEEESGPLPSDVRFRWLSQGFVIAGVACMLYGAAWAWRTWETIRRYPATTEAVPVDYKEAFTSHLSAPPEIPFTRRQTTFSILYGVRLAYIVDGKTYYSVLDCEKVPSRVPIHYDPHHPESHIAGSLTPPWMILALALGIGAFLSFVGYQFR